MSNMKKVILKLDLDDEKAKQKAMRAVSTIPGIDEIVMDMKEKKLTVVGDIDPVDVVSKLRKLSHAEIVTVGPAKEEKKDEKKEDKKEEPKKDDDAKKKQEEQIAELVKLYKAYDPHTTTHYCVNSVEENPNACVIC